jgi:hypothetical protein
MWFQIDSAWNYLNTSKVWDFYAIKSSNIFLEKSSTKVRIYLLLVLETTGIGPHRSECQLRWSSCAHYPIFWDFLLVGFTWACTKWSLSWGMELSEFPLPNPCMSCDKNFGSLCGHPFDAIARSLSSRDNCHLLLSVASFL